MTANNTGTKKLSKKTLNRAWADWAFWSHCCYNWVRMQGIGFAHTMVPVTKELYADDPEARKEVMKREMEFFNTEPEIGIICHGLAIAMEEQKANGAPITGEMITSVKTSLMGPLAGLGDTFFQGVLIPICVALFIDMTLAGVYSAPIIYAVVVTALSIIISYSLVMFSYSKGNEAVLQMIDSGILDEILRGANIMGCTVMGALIATYVGVRCGISFEAAGTTLNLQEGLFDAIMPGILPLLLTLGCYLALKKGFSTTKVILGVVVIGIIGSLTGILA